MTIRRFSRALGIASIVAALATSVIASHGEDAPSGDPVNGKRVYLADGCFECHGRAGQGGQFNYQTPALAKTALPAESFIAFLREAPNDMPSFSAEVLSDKDAADIHAFLQSLPGPRPVKEIPQLNP